MTTCTFAHFLMKPITICTGDFSHDPRTNMHHHLISTPFRSILNSTARDSKLTLQQEGDGRFRTSWTPTLDVGIMRAPLSAPYFDIRLPSRGVCRPSANRSAPIQHVRVTISPLLPLSFYDDCIIFSSATEALCGYFIPSYQICLIMDLSSHPKQLASALHLADVEDCTGLRVNVERMPSSTLT